MNRRKILQLTGASFATGIGSSYADTNQEDDEEGENGPACTPTIQFGGRQLLIDDTGYSNDVWAVVAVENTGDAASGGITVTAEWVDEDGNFLDDDGESLPTLDAGETWLAHIRAFGLDPENIDDFNVTGEFDIDYPRTPRGMAVSESELVDEDDSRPEITGVAENTREEGLEYIEARGKFYDQDGTVLAGSRTWEHNFPAGADWNFGIRMQSMPYQAEEPTDHDATLDARSFQVQG